MPGKVMGMVEIFTGTLDGWFDQGQIGWEHMLEGWVTCS